MATFTDENDEFLVELIAKNPPLYDSRLKTYKDNIVRDNIWEYIASKLNKTSEDCRKRWKCIRDSYQRIKRKNKLPTGSAAGSKSKKWPLIERLTFLENVPTERKTSDSNEQSQVKYENSEEIYAEESNEEGEEQVVEEDALQEIPLPKASVQYQKPKTDQRQADTSRPSRSLKRRIDRVNRTRKQYKSLRQDREDSSEHEFDLFCKSLAVQLKNMPLDKALICQQKLQTVMTQERLKSIATYSPSRSPYNFIDVNFQSPRRSSSRSSSNAEVDNML